jgi:diguanylate cyclase (GGDEF)-like protein
MRGEGRGPWHPGIRLVLFLLVLIPSIATAVLTGSEALSSWRTREAARTVSSDATELSKVAAARADFNALEVPMSAVSYAAQIGVGESTLDSLLKPSVPFDVQLADESENLAQSPVFAATPALRKDLAKVIALIPEIQARTTTFPEVHASLTKMADDIDALWYRDFNGLQDKIATWGPPGVFEVHAAALYQAYQAFLAGGHEIEGGIYVLEGTGPADSKQELIQAAGEFQSATKEFSGHLTPSAQRVWHNIQVNPGDKEFAATIAQGVNVAVQDLPPPFVGNLTFAGSSMRPGLNYLDDLDHLVTAASQDLSHGAALQAQQAGNAFVDRLLFLALLLVVCVVAVVATARFLTKPLTLLSRNALQVHAGNFDVPPIAETGPSEVVVTTSAFNDMTDTLQAVEAKTVALADEDLSNQKLLTPLPGKTGMALQASIDALSNRIREQEIHRRQLHEAATHDRLTGLYNRAAIFDYLTNDVSRRRCEGETVAVLFVDLDGLKPLNDNFGHEVGDTAIVATGEVLNQTVGTCDIVGRLGGDEFLIVLCHAHSIDGQEMIKRIHDNLAVRTITVDDFEIPLTASVGVALTRCGPETDPMELVREADHAMYEAKKAARRVTFDLAAFARRGSDAPGGA